MIPEPLGIYPDPEPTIAGLGEIGSEDEVLLALKGCLVEAAASREVTWTWSKQTLDLLVDEEGSPSHANGY